MWKNEFNYYKINETFSHRYYQIPQELFINPLYKDKLNSDSKLLYGFLLDRLYLSLKNNWCDEDRKGKYKNVSFDFLGYTFRPRGAKNKYGKVFLNFLPGMSEKAKKAVRKEIKNWRIQSRTNLNINQIAEIYNSKIQGWINYYSHYYKTECYETMRYVNRCLIKWIRRKYKNINSRERASKWLRNVINKDKNLFAHWKVGILSAV